jgi:hypothetical protein
VFVSATGRKRERDRERERKKNKRRGGFRKEAVEHQA